MHILIIIMLTILINFSIITAETINKETDVYNIKAKSIEECIDCGAKKKVTLIVVDKKLNTKKEIVFPTRTVKINNLYILENNRILVHGELGSKGDILTIIDIKSDKPLDTIWGWDASFSKDLRMVAYKFRYPPHGLPLYYSDVLLAYDFSKTPIENSMDKSSVDNPEQRGYILYPEENRKNKNYYTIAQNEDEQHTMTSPIIWNDRSSMICFLDSVGNKTYLIAIDISRGLIDPTVNIQELNRKQFYKEQYLKHIDEEFKEEYEKARVVAKELRFTDDDQSVEITSFKAGPFEEKKVKIKITKGK